MSFLRRSFLLILFFHCAFSLRPDLDITGLSPATNNLIVSSCSGGTTDTTNVVYCPDNTWAYGFSITTSSTPYLYGVLNIALDCRTQTYDSTTSTLSSASSQIVQYTNMGTMGSLSLTSTNFVYCNGDSGRDFIRWANIQEWCPATNADHPTSVCNFMMHCSYSNDISTSTITNQTAAPWTGFSKCGSGWVVCGYQFRYLNSYQAGSFYGAMDVSLQCCKICEVQQSFYFTNAKLCDFCDPNCKECWGTSANCTKCLDGYTLSATNTCSITTTSSTPVTDFFNNQNTLSAGWTTNSPNSLNNVCGNFYIVGGYNGLASSHYLQKSISGLASHSLVRIRFHFFKIGDWGNNGFGLVDVNSVRVLEMTWATLETPIYYNNLCGSNNYVQNAAQTNILLSSSDSSLTVKIYVNYTGTGWWGIRGFVVTIYSCDASCVTCTGTLSTQCATCSSGLYLTSSGTCSSSCTSSQYADPTTSTCVTACPDNYYKNSADYTCYSTCPSGYYGNPLTGNCVSSCPTGYFGTGGLCKLCDFNCATCSTSSTNCNTCQYAWLGATPSCSNPIYASKVENNLWNSATTTIIDVTVASWTVSGAAGNYITTCGSYTLVGGNGFFGVGATLSRSYSSLSPHLFARITFYVMKEGNWNNNNFIVIVDTVSQTIITFSSTTDTSAYKLCGPSGYTNALRRVDVYFSHSANTMSVSITSDLVLDASQASWGIYAYTMTIFLCDSACLTCNTVNDATKCMSCSSGTFLQATSGPAQCLTTCPSHTYPDAPTNICQTCDASCTNCNSPGTSSDCTSCPSGSFLQTATGPAQCLATCPSNTYQDTVNNICQTCDNSCSTCQSPGDSSSCLSCPAGSYLQSSPGPAQCLGTCVAGKYPDPTNHICGSCDTSWVTCQSPGTSSCMSCPAGTFLQAATGPNQCLNICPSGTYQDTVNHICQTCDNSCSTCQSPGDSSSCMSCPSGSFLQTTGPSQCLTTCSTNEYKDTVNNLCKLCDSSCASCQSPGTSATCLTCSTGFYLQSLIGPALCLNTCPTHTYPNPGTLICQTCDASCNACQFPGTAVSCMSCSSGSYLQSTSGPAQCLATCPSHTYPDSSTNTCQTCDASCTNCQSPGTSSSCMSCPSGLFLQSLTGPAQCLNSCPTSHTYADSGTNICETCYSSCNNCQSPGTSTSCTSCASGYFLQSTVTPNQCLTTCPSHTYKDTTNRICQTCDASCSNCQSPGTSNDCTSCPSGTFLQSTAPSQCLNTCPSHTYKDNVNNICQTCDSSCLECQSPGTANDCSSCPVGYTLSSTAPCPCNSPCTSSQYLDASSVCQNCDASCKTCNGPTANACTSCNIHTYLHNSQCLSTCPLGYYPDSTTNTCNSCDPSCASCSIAGSTNCLTCASGFFLQALTAPSSCLNTCRTGTYKYNLNSTCLTCNSECVSCVGPNNNDCLTCISSKALNGTAPNICVSACADGYYFDLTISSCSACDSPCKTCSGAGTQNCYSCTSKFYLQSQSGPASCNSTCNSGFYPDNTTFACQVCYYTCLNCTTGTKNSCISCKNGFYLFGSTCITLCPSGYYGNAEANLCIQCDDSCQECINSSNFSCLSCNSNFYFVANTNSTSLTGQCMKIQTISPILKTTSSPLNFELSFPFSNYSLIYCLYMKKSSISIQGLSSSEYNFTIYFDKIRDIFIISLYDLSISIINSPKLILNLNPLTSLLALYPNVTLTTYILETNIDYYYYIDSSTQSMINSTAQTTDTINSAISDSFIANSALSSGSATFFNCMISMDMIRLLRFLEINYPQNVLMIFNANLPTADIIPNVKIDEDSHDGTLPQIFLNYGVSIYIFNNNGNNLIEAASYWFIGVISLILVKKFRDYKNKSVKIVLILLSIIFIWNYTVSYFLSNYLTFAFYTFLSYQFPTSATTGGQMNILYSVIVGVLVILIFPFILIKIQRMRPKILPFTPVPSHKDSGIENKAKPEFDHFKFNQGTLDKSEEKSPNKDKFLENLDTPGIIPPTPNEITPFNPMKVESPLQVKRVSRVITKMKMTMSNIMKNSDSPFEDNKTNAKNGKDSMNENSSLKQFLPLNRGTKDSIEHIHKANENVDMNRYGAFHKDFNQKSFFQKYFILWSLLHQLIYSLIITVSYHNPYEGLIVEMIFQILFIITLFAVNPFKERKELLQNFFNEICAFVSVLCAWWLAYNEKNGIVDESLKMKIGWGIVFSNLFLILVFIVRMLISWTIIIFNLLKQCVKKILKKLRRKKQVQDEGWGENEITEENGKGILDNIIEMENFLR